jgi:tetratricopeptide (TPR) repeat protein
MELNLDIEYINLLLKANSLKFQRELQKALEYLDRAIHIDNNDYSAYMLKTLIFIENRNYNEALVCTDYLTNHGYIVYKNKIDNLNDTEEIKFLNNSLHYYDYDSYVLFIKGRILNELKKFNEAIELFDKAIEINPKYSKAFSNKGNSLSELGFFEDAIESYNIALNLKPDCMYTYYNKGNNLKRLKRFDEALNCYNKAISLQPNQSFFNNKGSVLLEMQKFDDAIDCFDKSIEIEPNYLAYLNKGIVQSILNKNEEALDCFDYSIKIAQDTNYQALAFVHKGFALRELKRINQAIECFNKAVEINPEIELAKIESEKLSKRWSFFQKGVILGVMSLLTAVTFYFITKRVKRL